MFATVSSVGSAAIATVQSTGAVCVQTNNLLLTPLGPVINLFSGAFGGVLQPLAIAVLVILGVIALALILTKHAAKFLRLIGIVLAVPVAVVLAILLFNAIYTAFNHLC
jgi:hypothetical protein